MWPLMSVPASGSRAFRTAWAAFWWRRCCGGAVAAEKVSSRKVTPTPSVPPTAREGGRRPGLALHHLGEQGQPHRDDLAVLGQPGDGLVEERLLLRGVKCRALGKRAEGPAERRQHLAGVARVEEIDQGRCSGPRTSSTSRSRMKRLAASQKSSRTMTRHCTRPPSHCRRACTSSVSSLVPLARAATARTGRGRSAPSCPPARTGPGAGRPATRPGLESAGQVGTALAQALEQAGLRLLRRRLDVDRHARARPAAAAGPPSPATTCRSPTARRSGPPRRSGPASVSSMRVFQKRMLSGRPSRSRGPGQQFEEEVGVVGVEGPQALRARS